MDTADHSSAANEPAPAGRIIRKRDEVSDFLDVLAENATREIVIFAQQMDGALFNTPRLARALASFAARHRNNLVRIVVEDTQQALRDNDRIVGLCRRLSDIIHLHQVSEEHLGIREMFFVIDRRGYLHQQDITRPDYLSNPDNAHDAVLLARRFNEIWDRSESIPSLRSTGL